MGHEIAEWEAKKPFNVKFVRFEKSEGVVSKVVGCTTLDKECKYMNKALMWGEEGDCWDIMEPMSQGSPRLTNITEKNFEDMLVDHPQTFLVRDVHYDIHWE